MTAPAPIPGADAWLSPDGVYRYTLDRWWNTDGPIDTWVMLNPSTADAELDDPTIRRCVGFSSRRGAGGIRVVNLFALRATDPNTLRRHPDPIGPHNDDAIVTAAAASRADDGRVIAAWGSHVMSVHRGRRVRELIGGNLHVLGLTRQRHPRHPLYVRGDTELVPWDAR